jgi:hypothetical protein
VNLDDRTTSPDVADIAADYSGSGLPRGLIYCIGE